MLTELLTSTTRAELMRLLFNGSGEEHYLRGMEKLTSVKINSIQKEVKKLSSLDLLNSRKDGNRIYYRANQHHPLYFDLVSIVEKTVGLCAQLSKRLTDDRVESAFIFGSIAKGRENSSSDIDLVVIGNLGMRTLTKLLSGLQQKVGREINPHVFTSEEFKLRLKKKDHFLCAVMNEEIKIIKGDLNEYR